MSGERRFNLIQFDPASYKIGSVLYKNQERRPTDEVPVDQALSLYLQWAEHARAFLRAGPESSLVSIEMNVDSDERYPTELEVELSESVDGLKELDAVEVIFEVFRRCYSFQARVLGKQDRWIYLSIPESVFIFKQRELPRSHVETPVPVSLTSKEKKVSRDLLLTEISLTGVTLRKDSQEMFGESDGCSLKLKDHDFPVSIKRETKTELFLHFSIKDGLQYDQLFSEYIRLAYPDLIFRDQVKKNDLVSLYRRAGYFEQFSTEETGKSQESDLLEFWSQHDEESNMVDSLNLVVKTPNGTLTGASSMALAFHRDKTPLWIFHQLCALKKPELLHQSGDLYKWRAEFLAAYPSEVEGGVWFSSRSRWLERIYVKFGQYSSSKSELFAVSIYRKSFEGRNSDQLAKSIVERKIGPFKRFTFSNKKFVAGFHPRFLNAMAILDAVISPDHLPGDSALDELGGALVAAAEMDEGILEMSLPHGSPAPKGSKPVDDTDRYCKIHKSDLTDFLSSVEHSIAVTERKSLTRTVL